MSNVAICCLLSAFILIFLFKIQSYILTHELSFYFNFNYEYFRTLQFNYFLNSNFFYMNLFKPV